MLLQQGTSGFFLNKILYPTCTCILFSCVGLSWVWPGGFWDENTQKGRMEEGLWFQDSGNPEKFSLILRSSIACLFKFKSNIFIDFGGSKAAVYLKGKKMAFNPTNLFQRHISCPAFASVSSIWLSKTAMCYPHAPLSPSTALSGNLFYTIW